MNTINADACAPLQRCLELSQYPAQSSHRVLCVAPGRDRENRTTLRQLRRESRVKGREPEIRWLWTLDPRLSTEFITDPRCPAK